jgi:hypothetical protein
MGFNKKYLPDLSDLKSIRDQYKDDKRFLHIYLYSPDAIIGPSDSMEYLKSIDKTYNQNEKESNKSRI